MRIRITADLWNAKNCVAAGGKLMTGMVGEFVIVGEAADEQGYGP